MKLQLELNDMPPRAVARYSPKEYKLVALRDCATQADNPCLDTPDAAAEYWRLNLPASKYFNPRVECFVVLFLNTRRRVIGHNVVATGTLDTILVHAREVFAPAIVANAAAVILMHNHPSGEYTPSEADIRVTRDLTRGGQLLKVEVLDHVIMGHATERQPRDYCSLRELGYFST
jgi:DNA repair protein RadC